MEHALQILILFIAGLVAGTYGSVVGGGALVTFPVFILLGLPAEIATGTVRFSAAFLEGSSSYAFAKKKLVQWRIAVPIALISIPASIFGARLALTVSPRNLNIFVAVALVVLLLVMPYVKPKEPKKNLPTSRLKVAAIYLLALALAVYGGFHGAAYGTFIMFPFLLLGTSNLLQASGNARFIGCLASIGASIVFVMHGSVNYSFAIPQILGGIIGTQLGVRYATEKLSWVKYALSIVVIASVIKLLFEIF